MVVYEDVPVKKNSEIVHPGHPPVIDTGLLASASAKLKAGTILKSISGGLAAAAAADTPVAVLSEDSDGVNAEVMVIWHGTVIFGRLLDSSGTAPVAASVAMANKLRSTGIYPKQLFTSSKLG